MKTVVKVYGPYVSKVDGRKRVQILYNDNTQTVQSYARYLYEREYGRLPSGVEVDHIDEDCTNDIISNLQRLSKSENIKKAWEKGTYTSKRFYTGICSECGKQFTRPLNQVKRNSDRSGHLPFCSRRCAGKFNQRKQKTFRKPRLAQPVEALDLNSNKCQFESDGADHFSP